MEAFSAKYLVGEGYESTFTIKRTYAYTNAVTVAGTIDDAMNYSLSIQNKYVTVVSTTTSGTWYVVGND